jgi:hypothetical protein
MRYLSLALAISFGMGLLLFGATYPIFHDSHLAAGIAAMPIAGCHHIAEMLERREARRSVAVHHAAEIQSLAGFTVAWPLLILRATIAVFGIMLLAATVACFVIVYLFGDVEFGQTQEVGVLLIGAPIELVGGFTIGRWIGSRSPRASGTTVVLVAALAAVVAGGLVGLFPNAPAVLGQTPLQDTLIETLISFAILAGAGLLGQRQGRKRRFADYMDYLMSALPERTRGVLVELAFDEARRAGGAVLRADTPAPAAA